MGHRKDKGGPGHHNPCLEKGAASPGPDEKPDGNRRFRITGPEGFCLHALAPDDTGPSDPENSLTDKEVLHRQVRTLSRLQEKLFAQGQRGLLVIFQAMDAGGKDSCIKHVFSGVNPQGCQVVSFKTPSSAELRHDYLWRCVRALPERGHIGVFNRSWYEDVLISRVHPEALAGWNLPDSCTGPDIWDHRYQDIVALERYLSRNGYVIVKIFLHISREEQRKRLLARLENPDKQWKFALSDLRERACWDDYQDACDAMIRETATPFAPWYVIPANNKAFARATVAGIITAALEKLDLEIRETDRDTRHLLEKAEKALREDGG